MSMSSFITAMRVELRPIASFDDAAAVTEFCDAVRSEPRYFGPNAEPKAPPLTASRLLHPAGPVCVGAFLGDALVGLARLEPRRDARIGAGLTVVVRSPWRRAGVGTKLVRSVVLDPTARDLRTASMVVAKNNRAALALGRACGMDRIELAADRIELRARLGQPTLRCA